MSQKISPSTEKIMLIRHAEQPFTLDLSSPQINYLPFYGVTIQGMLDPDSLIPQGWQRAGALVDFFAPPSLGSSDSPIVSPDFLFASQAKSSSMRPIETITPLSQQLGIPIQCPYGKDEWERMAAKAMQLNGPVLICWPHTEIPCIANQILGNTVTAPQSWPAHRFDLVWVFDWDSDSGAYSFTQVPQNLLAGDQITVVPVTAYLSNGQRHSKHL